MFSILQWIFDAIRHLRGGQVAPQVDLQLDYRWVQVGKTNYFFSSTFGVPTDTKHFGDAASQNLMLIVRWFFQSPPPPLPPPAVRTFIVFIDFDKSNLTGEALQVVQQAVQTDRQTGMVRIAVTRHTDTVGSLACNQRLPERRADAVKTEMIREGLNAADITTVGRSFAEPLIPTGPGVREPQNRRAAIDLGR